MAMIVFLPHQDLEFVASVSLRHIFLEPTFYVGSNTFYLLSVSLACGGSTSENNSYIVQSSTTTAPATPCKYDVCPCNSDICRIRYDFTTHTLATQTLGSSLATGTPNAVLSKF